MEKHQKVFFYTNLGLKGTPNGKSGFNKGKEPNHFFIFAPFAQFMRNFATLFETINCAFKISALKSKTLELALINCN